MKYWQKVRVTAWFYEWFEWKLISKQDNWTYGIQVKFDGTEIWWSYITVLKEELQLIED